MTVNTNDMNMDRERKFRSQIRMSKEFLKGYLGIPEGYEIINVNYEASREIVNVVLSGQDATPFMFEVAEGMEIPQISPTEWFEEATRQRFINLTDNEAAAQQLLRNDQVETRRNWF